MPDSDEQGGSAQPAFAALYTNGRSRETDPTLQIALSAQSRRSGQAKPYLHGTAETSAKPPAAPNKKGPDGQPGPGQQGGSCITVFEY